MFMNQKAKIRNKKHRHKKMVEINEDSGSSHDGKSHSGSSSGSYITTPRDSQKDDCVPCNKISF